MKYIQLSHPWTKGVELNHLPKIETIKLNLALPSRNRDRIPENRGQRRTNIPLTITPIKKMEVDKNF